MKIGDLVRVYNPHEDRDVSIGILLDLQQISNKKTNKVYSPFHRKNVKLSDAQVHVWGWVDQYYPFEIDTDEVRDFEPADFNDFKFDLKKAVVFDCQDNKVSEYVTGSAADLRTTREKILITFMQVSKVEG